MTGKRVKEKEAVTKVRTINEKKNVTEQSNEMKREIKSYQTE